MMYANKSGSKGIDLKFTSLENECDWMDLTNSVLLRLIKEAGPIDPLIGKCANLILVFTWFNWHNFNDGFETKL